LLRGDSVNISRCQLMPACNNIEGVMICDAYSSCYVVAAAYVCVVTSHNRRVDANGILCGSAPRLYGWTDQPRSVQQVSAVQLRVQLWGVNQQATEVEVSPLLRFVTRKRLVKTWLRNSHWGELLPSKD
jgi:hypothetical protein